MWLSPRHYGSAPWALGFWGKATFWDQKPSTHFNVGISSPKFVPRSTKVCWICLCNHFLKNSKYHREQSYFLEFWGNSTNLNNVWSKKNSNSCTELAGQSIIQKTHVIKYYTLHQSEMHVHALQQILGPISIGRLGFRHAFVQNVCKLKIYTPLTPLSWFPLLNSDMSIFIKLVNFT